MKSCRVLPTQGITGINLWTLITIMKNLNLRRRPRRPPPTDRPRSLTLGRSDALPKGPITFFFSFKPVQQASFSSTQPGTQSAL